MHEINVKNENIPLKFKGKYQKCQLIKLKKTLKKLKWYLIIKIIKVDNKTRTLIREIDKKIIEGG